MVVAVAPSLLRPLTTIIIIIVVIITIIIINILLPCNPPSLQ